MNPNLPVLMIDTDIKVYAEGEKALQAAGHCAVRVDSMIEGISKAKNAEFLFVAINADNIDYLPQLLILHDIVNAPIFIVKTEFDMKEHNEAIRNGAEGFGTWAQTPEMNLAAALTLVARYERRVMKIDKREVLVHNNLLLSLPHHAAFINTQDLGLTIMEFRILYYLLENRGMIASFSNIFRYAWGMGHEDSSHTILGLVKE